MDIFGEGGSSLTCLSLSISYKQGKEYTGRQRIFLFKIVLATQGPLRFHMNFRIGFSAASKNGIGTLIDIALNLPEKAMATHSSTLAWKIPWTEEPGRLQSFGSLRVGQD